MAEKVIYENKIFRETKVISLNLATDWIQSIRNMLGIRLLSYENAINKEQQLLQGKYLTKPVKWFKFDIEPMNSNAFIIMIYGEYE